MHHERYRTIGLRRRLRSGCYAQQIEGACVPTGICKICLNEKELVSSHLFLPARLYEYCRVSGMSPIKIGGGIVLPTDRQLQHHLLCKVCEDVLSGNGETWVNPRLATWE